MRLPKFELRRLASGVRADGRRPVRLPGDAARMLGPILCGAEAELALALLRDGRHRALGVVEVARGAANVVHLEPRELFRTAIHTGAVVVRLCMRKMFFACTENQSSQATDSSHASDSSSAC